MKKQFFTLVAIILICGGSAYAEVTPNLDKGTKQINIFGQYDNNSVLDYQLNLTGGFGYFFWDNIEIGAVLGWQSNDLSDTFELGVVGSYNFDTNSAWVPYLKLGILYAGVELDDRAYDEDGADANAAIGRFGGGVKYFFRDDIAMSLGLNYDIASEDLYFGDDGTLENDNLTLLVGIEFYFD